jgi:hypothetical protein
MPPKKPLQMDDTYLQIWKIEQEHSRTRWTVTTFSRASASPFWDYLSTPGIN